MSYLSYLGRINLGHIYVDRMSKEYCAQVRKSLVKYSTNLRGEAESYVARHQSPTSFLNFLQKVRNYYFTITVLAFS
jgi:hypothetical protein